MGSLFAVLYEGAYIAVSINHPPYVVFTEALGLFSREAMLPAVYTRC